MISNHRTIQTTLSGPEGINILSLGIGLEKCLAYNNPQLYEQMASNALEELHRQLKRLLRKKLLRINELKRPNKVDTKINQFNTAVDKYEEAILSLNLQSKSTT